MIPIAKRRITIFLTQKLQKQIGITSRCENGQHILFWDFVSDNYRLIKMTLQDVQRKHQIGDIHTFKSQFRESFRAITTDKFNFQESIKILLDTDYMDLGFITFSMRRQLHIIRLSPKIMNDGRIEDIEYIETLKNYTRPPVRYTYREKSHAYDQLLYDLYKIEPSNTGHDNNKIVERVTYETANIPRQSEKKVDTSIFRKIFNG